MDQVGLPMYLLYFALYMTSVVFGVYWMHRGLHEIKAAYKILHYDHHKYNKEHTLSLSFRWSGLPSHRRHPAGPALHTDSDSSARCIS